MANLIQDKKDELIQFHPYKLFEVDSKTFFYNVVTNAIFEIDSLIIDILHSKGKNEEHVVKDLAKRYKLSKIREAIQNMKEAYIIATDTNISDVEKMGILDNSQRVFKLSSLTLFMVQECNLRCTYCYGEEGEYNQKGKMTSDIARSAVDFLIQQSGEIEQLNITFFGGEPLLNFPLIQETVQYVHEQSEIHNKKFSFSITTNGTLITPKIKNFFYKHHFAVQTSIDGDEKTHNFNRFFKGGQGSYDLLLKRTEDMRNDRKIGARGTVTPAELDLSKSFDHLVKLGFRKIYLSPALYSLSDEHYDTLSKEMVKLVEQFRELLEREDYVTAKKMSNVLGMLSKIHSGGPRIHFCGAGTNAAAVDVRGNLFPCHRFVGEDECSIGNLFDEDPLSKQYNFIENSTVRNRTTCSKCWAKNLCGGGCHQENFAENGNVNQPVGKLCKVTKNFINATIKLYLQLTQEQRSILFG
ncbi:PapB family radical SAM/SPASM ranthipeptide maturase [Paenibacillus polymyxa]|uniref:PapB family radical SAM/SPASM ranthipeptide maturase n=1 Tax=Paenibacillus TaxID=44249 RepID=UPI00077C39C3|nr:SPASM domain-containing protein [Paenibacillus polymyxa]AOK90421.1 radical SAM/SPASM domain-containing protein [Paenibacillus polymyxa]KYG95462.1 radical SAM/SPASM domain-containing protein [Paenibacillus polymyxa]